MSSPSADWHLLFGLLALQNGLISREQLVSAFAKWTSDKSVPLDEILVADGALSPTVCDTLRQLVELHIQQNEGDPQKSLMALSGSDLPAAKTELFNLEDTDLTKSIAIMKDRVLDETVTYSVGQSTSSGGRFRILRPLPGARGGMGEISVAADEELGRQVALKQILPEKADNAFFRQKFQIEAEITGNLEHPGIVPVYGLGNARDGRPYYAMRLVHGDNLSARMKQFHEGSKSVDFNSVEFHTLVDRLVDVAQAIRYAHSRGVLHRDLKPGNILVGEYGETLVIDWGLARLPRTEEAEARESDDGIDGKAPLNIRSGSSLDATVQGEQLGTVGYAPPEQLNGRVDLIGERSDVYALGSILYQMLTGRPPIDRKSGDRDFGEAVRDTIEGKITPPRQIHRAIPKPLSAICLKALQREPADRYDAVAALIDDVERWKADQPITAAPDSLADRVMRLTRRYRNAALSTAATLMGVAIVALIAVLLINQARMNEAQALAKESEARTNAEMLAQRNQTVVDNFVAAFRSTNPQNEGVTSKMTALDVLQQAMTQIQDDAELSKDDLTKATLLEAIGESLSSLGEYNQAITAHKETFRLRKAGLGDEHVGTLASMNNLASAYQDAGRLDQALPLYEKTLRLRKAQQGDEHPDTLISMNNLAEAYQAAGRLEEAVSLLEATLRVRKAHLDEDHPDTLTSMNNLAGAYVVAGRLDEALPLLEETLRLSNTKLGDDHPHTVASMNNLAGAYLSTGRLDEALPLLEESLRIRKAKLGDGHPDTLTGMMSLAQAYQAAGRRDQALPLFEETLRLSKAKLGDGHPSTLTAMHNVAFAYLDAGRLDEALPLLEETLRLTKDQLGEGHPDTLTSMNNLAGVHYQAGRLKEALALLEETLRLRRIHQGDAHPATLSSIYNLAGAYAAVGRLAEALPLLEESLRVRKAKLGDGHPATLDSMNGLALTYHQLGRLDDALPLYEETLRLMKARLGEQRPKTLTCMCELQELFLEVGKIGAAKNLAEDWIRILKRSATPARPQLARAEISLAQALLGTQNYADAMERVTSALNIDEIEDLQRLRALNIKGAVLASDGKWGEAEPLLVESTTNLVNQVGEIKISQRWYVPRACERVITMYEAWGKPEEAAKWRTKLAEVNAEIERLRNQHAPAKDSKDGDADAKSANDSTPDRTGEHDRSEIEPK